MNKIEELLAYQQEIANLEYTINLLSWELKISTPRNAERNLMSLITDFEDKLFTLKTAPIYERILTSAINSKEFNLLEEAEQRYILNLLRLNFYIPLSYGILNIVIYESKYISII